MSTKVFISYAHENERFQDMILKFSNYLRSRGIDAEIDQYEESPVEGWPKWMMRQIQNADFVLVVCSDLYIKRFNDFTDSPDGLGVKWETTFVIQELYEIGAINNKYIPIVFNEADIKCIPSSLRPYTYYKVNEEAKCESLISRLLRITSSKRPPLNEEYVEPPLDIKERKSMFISSIIDVDLWNKAHWKGMVYASDPNLKEPPIIGFWFQDNKFGKEIFSTLKKQFGNKDENEEIRISLIRGISKENSLAYKVHIGSSWDAVSNKMKLAGMDPLKSIFMGITRIHAMYPPAESNSLEVFKHAYEYFKTYYITNIISDTKGIRPDLDNLIRKNIIHFRNKKDIINNQNDEDFIVFKESECV